MARERINNPSKKDLEKFKEECGIEVNTERDIFTLLS
jgi:hypothetical protein